MKAYNTPVYRLADAYIEDIVNLDMFELEVLLYCEPYDELADIVMESMLEYFVVDEEYEKACLVRDEINHRGLVNFKRGKNIKIDKEN